MTNNMIIEIVDAETSAIVVCDTLAYCAQCDDGLADEAEEIAAALNRGDDYLLGGGAALGYIIRKAPAAAIVNA